MQISGEMLLSKGVKNPASLRYAPAGACVKSRPFFFCMRQANTWIDQKDKVMKLRNDFNREAKRKRKQEHELNMWFLFWIILMAQQSRMEAELQRIKQPVLRYG